MEVDVHKLIFGMLVKLTFVSTLAGLSNKIPNGRPDMDASTIVVLGGSTDWAMARVTRCSNIAALLILIWKAERSWSGNLAPPPPPPYEQIRNASTNRKKNCRRFHSTGAVYDGADEPRLVRSAGMRRDWSFEDLAQTNDHIIIRKSGRLS
ncbi:hypothetical protein Ddye_001082 [Dipteronia dyeriana]|uniref:Uncharacterized protein n=1 Tax=Dipteronia dyeriana TaxID=168575 RepID=A0AAD9XNI2_9ROSI|nr:hypothetical protein Ddye_001082 [Dipteronia dyeriana]